MAPNLNIVVTRAPLGHADFGTEICEHKGIGHPDSICDGVAEAVSQALCAAYLRAYGEVRHHNVDKALLIGGQSNVRFGGGHIEVPMRLIVAGRADPLPDADNVAGIVQAAAQSYLVKHLHCPVELFDIESAVRSGSPNLRRVFTSELSSPLANDTSFGVGFAPYSWLENAVLRVAEFLKSTAFRNAFPMAGDDFKVMGVRTKNQMAVTIALAFVDREIESAKHYLASKAAMVQWLSERLDKPCPIGINMLDDKDASEESGLFLTVTGLSAEHGDDGQVGRGNRVSGLITPSRPMSLEAAAGKNPVSHVGKIYNVLASQLAADLVEEVPIVEEATVTILSCIGQPINRPALVDIQVAGNVTLDAITRHRIREISGDRIDRISLVTQQLIAGTVPVF